MDIANAYGVTIIIIFSVIGAVGTFIYCIQKADDEDQYGPISIFVLIMILFMASMISVNYEEEPEKEICEEVSND
jgi:hypothetical protein